MVWPTKLSSATTRRGTRLERSYCLLNFDVGKVCFCRVLGIGTNRLDRMDRQCVDLRYNLKDALCVRPTPKKDHCDQYFALLYLQQGETLPDRSRLQVFLAVVGRAVPNVNTNAVAGSCIQGFGGRLARP
jgi:hypothetical protein